MKMDATLLQLLRNLAASKNGEGMLTKENANILAGKGFVRILAEAPIPAGPGTYVVLTEAGKAFLAKTPQ